MVRLDEAYKNNFVGPILRAGDVATAAVEAVHIDNPGKKINVDDRTAYVRIGVERECILKRSTMQELLGRPFEMRELEVNLSSFAGQIETEADHVRFYFAKNI
jgi:toluene monooxygenase system protein D